MTAENEEVLKELSEAADFEKVKQAVKKHTGRIKLQSWERASELVTKSCGSYKGKAEEICPACKNLADLMHQKALDAIVDATPNLSKPQTSIQESPAKD